MSIFNQPWMLKQNRIRGKGGREIDKFRGIEPPVDDDSGSEAWIGSVTKVERPPEGRPNMGRSEVTLPDGREMFLFEAIALSPKEVLGEAHMKQNGEGLGVLVKYLDAEHQYGLQCHPTREWADKMWGSPYGKEESWYVIGLRDDVEEPPYIILGFKEGVTREMWEEHYFKADLKALENLCHKFPVKVGEAYFVGGGCPHALGEGCFVIEVQEPSDITLGALPLAATRKLYKRMPKVEIDEKTYDERLLGAYVYDGCDEEENLRRWRAPRKTIREGAWGKEEILVGPDQTNYFSFTELAVNGAADIRDTGFPQIAIVLEGEGKITFDGGEFCFKKADEIFLPYSIPNAKVEGSATIVLCHPEGVTY